MGLISEYFLLFCSISCVSSEIVLKKELEKNEALLLIGVGIIFLIIFGVRNIL